MSETTARRRPLPASAATRQGAATAVTSGSAEAPAAESGAEATEGKAKRDPNYTPTFSGLLKGLTPPAIVRSNNGKKAAFPFDEMAVGDAFLVAADDEDQARKACSTWTKKNSVDHPTAKKNHKGNMVPVRVAQKMVILVKLSQEQCKGLSAEDKAKFGEQPFAVFRVAPPAAAE